jgi:DNA-binding CsgD family transcriptional regulator
MGRNVTEAATQEMGSSMIDLSSGACFGLADETYAESDPFHPEPTRGPTPKDLYAEAAAICKRCPIRDLCLQDALTETVQWGYRGGMDPEARQALKSGEVTKQRGAPTDQDLERRMALYSQGLNDAQMGAQLGVTDKTITAWRKRNNLPANHPAHAAHTPAQNIIKMRAWEAGETDFEIARQAGCKVNAIRKWRMRLGLKVNPVRERVPA